MAHKLLEVYKRWGLTVNVENSKCVLEAMMNTYNLKQEQQ